MKCLEFNCRADKHFLLFFSTVYVDSSERCNDLSFQLGGTATGVTAIATRKWSIKVKSIKI